MSPVGNYYFELILHRLIINYPSKYNDLCRGEMKWEIISGVSKGQLCLVQHEFNHLGTWY